jgi:hypothetical protein
MIYLSQFLMKFKSTLVSYKKQAENKFSYIHFIFFLTFAIFDSLVIFDQCLSNLPFTDFLPFHSSAREELLTMIGRTFNQEKED